MKEALRHSITKTNMLNFLLVHTVLFMLCYAFTPLFLILTLKERSMLSRTHTVVSKALSIRVVILPSSPGQNRNVHAIYNLIRLLDKQKCPMDI